MSDQNNSTPNVQSLKSLLSGSGISQNSQSIIIDNLQGNNQVLAGAGGTPIGQLLEDDVTVVTLIVDMSSSMAMHEKGVIDGFNQMLKAIRDSKLEDSVLMSLWTFNQQPNLVFDNRPIANVPDLNDRSYVPNGSTALYDTALNGMTGNISYVTDLRNNGVTARGIVIVISDGEDNESSATPAKLKSVAQDMVNQEIFTLAFFAFGFHGEPVAKSMGFESILETGKTEHEMREALNTVSKSIIRNSQTQISASGTNFFN